MALVIFNPPISLARLIANLVNGAPGPVVRLPALLTLMPPSPVSEPGPVRWWSHLRLIVSPLWPEFSVLTPSSLNIATPGVALWILSWIPGLPGVIAVQVVAVVFKLVLVLSSLIPDATDPITLKDL